MNDPHRDANYAFARLSVSIIAIFGIVCFLMAGCAMVFAKDDGRYSNSPLKAWFDHLASGKGLCCSIADGRSVADPDWGTHDDRYWVIVDDVRYAVPQDAVITEPNKFGQAVVWPAKDENGTTYIRCFIPGSGT